MNVDAQSLQTSQIHTWIGIVAQDKVANSISIEVLIPELTPVVSGTVSATTGSQTVSLLDLDGGTVHSTVTTKTTVTAYYHGNSTNRKYPPDVVQGEQVRVFKYANSDKYYWESMGRNDDLRKTELYRIEAKNRKSFEDPSDDAHAYSLEMDTKNNQWVRILTSTGNGEEHVYTLLIDAKNSKVQLADEIGNSLTIDSNNSRVLLRNSSKSLLMLNGVDAILAAPETVSIKAGTQLIVTSPVIAVNNTSGSGTCQVNSNAMSINMTKNMSVSSPLLSLNSTAGAGVLHISSTTIAMSASDSIVATAPAIGLNGAVKIPDILAVNNLRAYLTAGTAVGTAYAASGTSAPVSNTPDTTMPTGQRHSVAWEQFNQIMTIVVQCFNDIEGSTIGRQSQITPLQPVAEMLNVTGV